MPLRHEKTYTAPNLLVCFFCLLFVPSVLAVAYAAEIHLTDNNKGHT